MANGIIDSQAHRLTGICLRQVEPDRGEYFYLRLPPERLGIDEKSVEIEDHRGDGLTGLGGRGGDLGAQVSFFTMSTMASPASVGFWATVTPAADNASILARAVPLDPEMMAPACPIFRPAGAVTPAT